MKVYELPSEIQARVFQLQSEAGNKPDASLELIAKSTEGGFDWHKSKERASFWKDINTGYYGKFYNTYPNGVPDSIVETRAKDIIVEIMRELPFVLSEHNADDLIEVINKKLQPYIIYRRVQQ